MLLRVTLIACLALAVGCTTVPGSDRSQFNFIPRSTADSLGNDAWQQALAEATVVQSGTQAEMIQRIGKRIIAAAERLYPKRAKGYTWQFALIDEPQTVNAWALPGGKSAVYTGLLTVTQDEKSLAMVMGHEVAHVLAHHGSERMSQGMGLQGVMIIAQLATADRDPEQQGQMMQLLGMAGQAGVILPFSRNHESEADHLGLMMAADAGYNPQAAVSLWQRMAATGGGERPPEFMSTHPSEATRIKRLQELMPEALKLFKAAKAAGR
ncbi:MAG: putative Zn-dependent protease [Pseudohongiellaceae bacterium]|jgi:predicted Zn-dependent protease